MLALVALLAWLWFYRGRTVSDSALAEPGVGLRPRLRRSALAWQVTVLMGAQSALAYIVFGWLPTLLRQAG